MTDDLVTDLEQAVELEGAALRKELPPVLERMTDKDTVNLVREHPAVFGKLVRGLEASDVATFVDEAPDASAAYQDVLWTGLSTLVEDDADLQAKIGVTLTVNFKANDCAMEGHLELDKDARRLSGGAGLASDPDITITGEAKNVVGLITGSVDPIQGFMQGAYKMDGSMAKGTRMAPTIKALAKAIPEA